jgi:hypothetical protein
LCDVCVRPLSRGISLRHECTKRVE